MISAPRRNAVQKVFGKIPVWIDQPHSVAQRDVLNNQVSEQGCFTRTGFANDIHVMAVIVGRNAKSAGVIPAGSLSNDDGRLVIHDCNISRYSTNRRQTSLGTSGRGNSGWR